eukprot:CAMPEP_0203816550 /NCGR_PEP_ID=MMETSP0115-20131106/16054_1 /ASSEMBLY_ACC=CAM_ASM_000227 /TAXON_ID=33651 /ORGANISM="Bicosoecid sp, Strain ms1" /LENGTH=396 /DNA_ID=CAMNT_0050725455 /DNA_START=33 /DNA_END=1223 /DNA_ORIENTATION=-
MAGVFLVAAKRTPFGTFGGSLVKHSAKDLAIHASKAALAAGGVDPALIDSVIFGNVAQTSEDAPYLARHVGLSAGAPIPSTALTINRLCGSGFQAVINAAQEIQLGETRIALVGGTESMSQAPMAVYGHNARFGTKLGTDMTLKDTLWAALTDSHTRLPMAITAENLAEQYGLSRADCDEYGYRSQQAWAAAHAAGVFDDEIAPMELKGRKGPVTFSADEHPRPQATVEAMSKLPAVFKKDGVVTAGNASGICDGAAALIVASEAAVKEHGLTPLARLVSWGIAGVDPTVMGIGPVPAMKMAASRAGHEGFDDFDLLEINEAFAAQYLACEKELGLDRSKTNISGGAIALGHPLAASGARITGHLAHRLKATGGKRAIGAACIGGGQGISVVLESA